MRHHDRFPAVEIASRTLAGFRRTTEELPAVVGSPRERRIAVGKVLFLSLLIAGFSLGVCIGLEPVRTERAVPSTR